MRFDKILYVLYVSMWLAIDAFLIAMLLLGPVVRKHRQAAHVQNFARQPSQLLLGNDQT